MPLNEELVGTAFHEGGHAVVVACLGAKVKSANVHRKQLADRVQFGVTTYRPPVLVVSQMAIILAGPLAQWERNNRAGNVLGLGSSGDQTRMSEFLTRLYHREVKPSETEEFNEGAALAYRMIDLYWGAIEHIANRLLSHREISGVLVHAIVNECRTKLEKACLAQAS